MKSERSLLESQPAPVCIECIYLGLLSLWFVILFCFAFKCDLHVSFLAIQPLMNAQATQHLQKASRRTLNRCVRAVVRNLGMHGLYGTIPCTVYKLFKKIERLQGADVEDKAPKLEEQQQKDEPMRSQGHAPLTLNRPTWICTPAEVEWLMKRK